MVRSEKIVLDRVHPKPSYPVAGGRVRLTEPVSWGDSVAERVREGQLPSSVEGVQVERLAELGGVPTETSPSVMSRLLGSEPKQVVDSGYHQELAAFWLAKHAEAERGVGGGGGAA